MKLHILHNIDILHDIHRIIKKIKENDLTAEEYRFPDDPTAIYIRHLDFISVISLDEKRAAFHVRSAEFHFDAMIT